MILLGVLTNAITRATLAEERALLAEEKVLLADEKALLAEEKVLLVEERASLLLARAFFAEDKITLAEKRAYLAENNIIDLFFEINKLKSELEESRDLIEMYKKTQKETFTIEELNSELENTCAKLDELHEKLTKYRDCNCNCKIESAKLKEAFSIEILELQTDVNQKLTLISELEIDNNEAKEKLKEANVQILELQIDLNDAEYNLEEANAEIFEMQSYAHEINIANFRFYWLQNALAQAYREIEELSE